jgi:hypothetical protein
MNKMANFNDADGRKQQQRPDRAVVVVVEVVEWSRRDLGDNINSVREWTMTSKVEGGKQNNHYRTVHGRLSCHQGTFTT